MEAGSSFYTSVPGATAAYGTEQLEVSFPKVGIPAFSNVENPDLTSCPSLSHKDQALATGIMLHGAICLVICLETSQVKES